MFFTYILYSPSADRFYIGSTGESMEHRLRRHLSNHKGYTGKYKDWEVVFIKEFESRSEAFKFEMKIKSWKDRKLIISLISGSEHPG